MDKRMKFKAGQKIVYNSTYLKSKKAKPGDETRVFHVVSTIGSTYELLEFTAVDGNPVGATFDLKQRYVEDNFNPLW